MNYKLLICLTVLCIFCNCRGKDKNVISEEEVQKTEEALIGANRLLIQKDRAMILEYIKQNNLNLKESPTGLWYGIYYQGTGEKVKENVLITLNYKLSLLNGTLCYSSDLLGPKQFVVGKGNIESGLEEGVLLLNEGSKAMLILPPHLAHGLQGDGNKIPARSIIIYDVHVTNIEQ